MTDFFFSFDTLSHDPYSGPVLCMTYCCVDTVHEHTHVFGRTTPSTYFLKLVDNVKFIKFDVADQIENYAKKPSREVLSFWKESEERMRYLKPLKIDKPISSLYDEISNYLIDYGLGGYQDVNRVFVRGAHYHPVFLKRLCMDIRKPELFPEWSYIDIRSYIEGLTIGQMYHAFIPNDLKGVYNEYDVRHKIAIDIYRIVSLMNELQEDDDVPF